MSLSGDTPWSGYMVGCYPNNMRVQALTRDNIEIFISNNYQLLKLSSNYVGIWFNDGKWVFDVVKHIQDLDAALDCAEVNRQDAIYSNENGRTIYVQTLRLPTLTKV